MGKFVVKARLSLYLLLSAVHVWSAEMAPPPPTVIKLPLKLKVESPHKANKPELAASNASKPDAIAKPPVTKSEAKHESAAKAVEPEKLAPEVKQAPAPVHQPITEASPEVRAPGSKPHSPKKVRQHHHSNPPQKKAPAAPLMMSRPVGSVFEQVRTLLKPLSVAIRATVVRCADAKEERSKQPHVLMGDLLVVNSMGNQLAVAESSIKYGVRQLGTPVLLFVGNADCEATRLAAGNYERLDELSQQGIASIDIPKGIDPVNGALLNVNNQVEAAILVFPGEVEAGKLAILGGFYDVGNELRQGSSKLVITNWNGETDPTKIRELSNKQQFFKYGFMDKSGT
ncbi:hypothetical protein HZU77_016150 [Neisseriaceae bacterium TC5R-5]|nr:hypothetical protein [Neisseriaceae bacterium TC5R-5]